MVCIRPETVQLAESGAASAGVRNRFPATIEAVTDFGEYIDYSLRLGQWSLRTKALSSGRAFRPGEAVAATLDPERTVIVPE